MDWRSIRFDWNRARAFFVTAEEGSLSAAARALGLTQPTLGRQVSALESELGVALFERRGTALELTPNGVELLAHVRRMADAASGLSLSASGKALTVEGNICISATEIAAAYILPPIVRDLRQRHPGIFVEIIASNSTSDLKRREADIAVRAFRPTQSDLIARKLGTADFHLYASPAYLDAIGNPDSAQALSAADFIAFDRSRQLIDALNDTGFELDQSSFPLLTDNHLVQWELAKAGAGICVMAATIGDAEPAVRRALPGMKPMVGEHWLVAHRELRTSRRVRVVFDFLADALMRLH